MGAEVEVELAGLMRAALSGDERSYREFLRRAGRLVQGFARGKLERTGIDPEDIVQETLLAIHMKRHTWRTDAPVMPWIYAIARHKLIDALRSRARRKETHSPEFAQAPVEPDTARPGVQELGRVLDSLSPGQRSVVKAVSVEGRSIRETAKNHAMSETAVRVALHRGLTAIASRFGRN